jgi:hypothetical protein
MRETTGQIAPGWASLIGITMIMSGGAQLIFIGLIGQYLARVFEELKGRPLYILKQEPASPSPRTRVSEAPPVVGSRAVPPERPPSGPGMSS